MHVVYLLTAALIAKFLSVDGVLLGALFWSILVFKALHAESVYLSTQNKVSVPQSKHCGQKLLVEENNLLFPYIVPIISLSEIDAVSIE